MKQHAYKALILLTLFCINLSTSHANPLSTAWNCAKAKVKMDIALASKGLKASEIIGSSPQCVALASSSDISLYLITGTLFSLNALKPELLPAASCGSALKASATYPIAMTLDKVFPNIIPASYKDLLNQEAQNNLWNFLSTTPPISAVIDRAKCGCTFLEAGLSVDGLKEILSLIASTGKRCEKFLESIPGYSVSKNALNNLSEDLFTNQYAHKSVDEYYRNDFNGGILSTDVQSHAIAKIINPNHNWNTTFGASVIYHTYVLASGGAASGSVKKSVCKSYFDNHKMSPENAEKVCQQMMVQFENEINSLMPKLKGRNELKNLVEGSFKPALAVAENDCQKLYAKYGLNPLPCLSEVRSMEGSLAYMNPYDGSITNSLGFPISKEEVDSQVKGRVRYYFLSPLSSSGAREAALEAYENGTDAKKAVEMAVSTYQASVKKLLFESNLKLLKYKNVAQDEVTLRFQNEVGNIWGPQCVANFSTYCRTRLRQAWELCPAMVAKYVGYTGSGDVWTINPVQEAKYIQDKCIPSYNAIVKSFTDFNKKLIELDSHLSVCPTQLGNVVLSCKHDHTKLKLKCAGGMPSIKEEFHVSGNISQSPVASKNCNKLIEQFKQKWQSEDEILTDVYTARSVVSFACDKIGLRGCSQTMDVNFQKCLKDLQGKIRSTLWPAPFEDLTIISSWRDLFVSVNHCSETILGTLDTYSRTNVISLALRSYGTRCFSKDRTITSCLNEISETAKTCSIREGRRMRMPQGLGTDIFMTYCREDLNQVIRKYSRSN